MKIHTLGDSHSVMGWNTVFGIYKHYVGPKLAYSIGRDGSQLDFKQEIENGEIQKGDVVIFCFGEIDTRCHVHKHITAENSYQTIINNIVDKYLESIQKETENTGITVAIYNIVPPVHQSKTPDNTAFPFRGTDEERREYVRYFNQKLREGCDARGFVFFDVHDRYADSDGFLIDDLSDNNVHVRNGIFLDQQLSVFKSMYGWQSSY